jgi:hypothetical protein
MLREWKPKRYVEIGCGFSSAFALDVNEHFFANSIKMSFIEPHPALLLSLLKPGDTKRIEIIPNRVRDVDPTFFESLAANDFLFIDSTHVAKTGSDVVFELFQILPKLKRGVVVHFHDVFYPFEYPREWVIDRNYSRNEIYAIRAFLMYNSDFEILFFNDFFAQFSRHLIVRDVPAVNGKIGGGLWLRRL